MRIFAELESIANLMKRHSEEANLVLSRSRQSQDEIHLAYVGRYRYTHPYTTVAVISRGGLESLDARNKSRAQR